MYPASYRFAKLRRLSAYLLLAALGFLALAIFSPLHQHEANGRWSLHDFEHILIGETEMASPCLELSLLAWTELPSQLAADGTQPETTLFLRGPPADL